MFIIGHKVLGSINTGLVARFDTFKNSLQSGTLYITILALIILKKGLIMATKLPRINVTVSSEIDNVLNSLSDAVGTSKSKIILELLNDALPMFKQVIAAVNKAKDGNKEGAMDGIRGMLADAAVKLNDVQLDLVEFRKEVLHE